MTSNGPRCATSSERDRVLDWGRGPVRPSPQCTLHDLVNATVERYSAQPAVVQGESCQTYGQLAASAAMVAARLRAAGVKVGSTVGVCVRRDAALPAVLLGVLEAGAAYVPLDPSLPTERRRMLLTDSGAVACLVDASSSAAVPEGPWVGIDLDDRTCDDDVEHTGSRATPQDAAYVLFTSGSTGRPKGVCVEHSSVVDFVIHNAIAYGIGPGVRVLCLASLGFDVSVSEIFSALATGATVVMAREEDRHSADQLAALLVRERVAVAELPPALLGVLDPELFPALRLVSVGGEAPSARQVARWVRCGIRVINAYGPTETTVSATLMDCSGREQRSVPIGRPMPNHRAYVLDENADLVAPGTPGELWIAGAGVARGYVGKPELTAERFRIDPYDAEGGRMYRTGDRVAWNPDGTLEFLGRVDGQLNLRGFRIEPGEVETRLRTHPRVADAAVDLRDDGSGPRLVAYVVPDRTRGATGPRFDSAALRAWCGLTLPLYMVPATFLGLDALPLTAAGKLDRAALAAVKAPEAEVVAPRTDDERAILELWRELLPEAPPFGVEDEFAALGGHSLLGMRLLARLRHVFEVTLTPADLAGTATVASLARRVADAKPAPATGLIRRGSASPPMSFGQQRLWFAELVSPGLPTYHLPIALRLHGSFDAGAFRRALATVTDRHDALRMWFENTGGAPTCRVAPSVAPPLTELDLRHVGGDREAAVQRLIDSAVRDPFRFDRGPLWRALLVRVADDEHVFVLVAHHAIADGWSLSLVLDEISAGYRGEAPKPGPPVQYGDFADWERRRLEGVETELELAHWARRLADAPTALPLPADRARPPVQTFRAGRVTAAVAAELADGVKAIGAGLRASPFSVLLAPFGLLLGRLAGTEDVVVSCPVAQRADTALEGVVGLLVDAVPVRLDVHSAASSVADLVHRTSSAVLDARTHGHVPFELIVQAVHPPRDPGRAPLAQVGFNLLNYPAEQLTLPGLRVDQMSLEPTGALLDLTLYVREEGGGFQLEVVYNRDLYDESRMVDFLASYVGLLGQVVADPSAALDALSLVSADARRRLPDPAEPLSAETGPHVLDRFLARVSAAPMSTAVDGPYGAISYAELDDFSDRVAGALAADGVGRQGIVAVAATRSVLLPVALLGVAKAGAAAQLVDVGHPARRVVESLTATAPAAWLALDDAPIPPELDRALGDWAPVDRALGDWAQGDWAPGDWARGDRSWRCRTSVAEIIRGPLRGPEVTQPPVPREPAPLDEAAFVLSTSGSSGSPRAVVSTGRPLAHFLDWYVDAFGLNHTDRFAVLSGVAHDPVLRDVLVPLALGACVCVPPPEIHRAPDALLGWLRRERITVVHLTPQLGRLLASSVTVTSAPPTSIPPTSAPPTSAPPTSIPLPDLRLVVLSGDVLLGSDLTGMATLAPRARIISGYGATETPQLAGAEFAVEQEYDDRVPIGSGIPGTQLLVLTGTGELAGVGELGEIVVRTPFLAEGYVGEPDLTAERFETESSGSRRYRTGDLGRFRPDGRVEFVGRRDGQVKIRGFRLETGEVEAAIRQCPGVADALVVAVEDAEGGHSLVAYAIADHGHPTRGLELLVTKADRAGHETTADGTTADGPAERGPAEGGPADGGPAEDRATDAIRRQLRRRLPDHAVPQAVVWVPAFPLTANNKIDVSALPPPRIQTRLAAGAAPPTSAVQQAIAQAWCSVLKLPVVGVDDNFFDVGGTSLRLVEIQNRLQHDLSRLVPIVDLFHYPTIRALAAHLAGGPNSSNSVSTDPAESRSVLRRVEARRDRRRRRA